MRPATVRRSLPGTLLVLVALTLAGCDAGRRVVVRAQVTDAPRDVALTSCCLRCFWFDDADDELFSAPVEDQVARVGEARWHSPSRGVCMTEWLGAAVDEQGNATLSVLTFYAGGLPATELFTGPLEEDPVGMWFEVVAPEADVALQGFVVRDLDDGPTVVRVQDASGLPAPGPPAGRIDVLGWDAAEQAYVWRVTLPLAEWRAARPAN